MPLKEEVDIAHGFIRRIEMTPVQVNEVIEDKLALLKPQMENLHEQMVETTNEFKNGRFSVKGIFERIREEER